MSLLLSASGTALLVGGLASLASASTNLTVTVEYTETDDSGAVISPGAVWLSVTGWTGWDSATAPSGDGEYVPALCEIEYYWEVRHVPGTADFSARADARLPSSPAVFRDCSKQRGASACVQLPESGAYERRLFAYEPSSGKTYDSGWVPLTTTVSEDDAFPGTRTICYSIDGTFTGKPTGAQEVSSLAAMQTAISNAITAGDTFRILLRRGETYAGSNIDFTWPTTFPNFRSGTYGSGADPVVESPAGSELFTFPSGGGSKHVWIGPIHWKGRWDTVNDRGYGELDARLYDAAAAAGTFTLYGARHTGGIIPMSVPQPDNSAIALINCDISDYRGYGLLGTTNASATNRKQAWVGCFLGCVEGCVDGINGRSGAGEWANRLANASVGGGGGWILRTGDHNVTIIQHCEFSQALGAQVNSHQGPLRFNTSGKGGDIASIAYCVWEGGGIGAIDTNRADIQAINMTVDSCLFAATGFMTVMMRIVTTGVIVRNCHFWNAGYTARLDGGTNGVTIFTGIDNDNGTDNKPYPVKAYNNTSYAKRDVFFHEVLLMSANGYSDLAFENNLKRDGADTDVTETVIAGYSPRYQGYKPGFPTIQHTLGGTWNVGETFTIPYPSGTDQAYWQALVGIDDFHMIRLADNSLLYADAGDFSVSFGSSDITITNLAAGSNAAQTIDVKLDRASQLPTPNGAHAADAAGTVSWCYIAAASEATFQISTGLQSYRDLDDTVRGSTAYQGAVEYA